MVHFISENWLWIGLGWLILSLAGACLLGRALNHCVNVRPLSHQDYERIAKGVDRG